MHPRIKNDTWNACRSSTQFAVAAQKETEDVMKQPQTIVIAGGDFNQTFEGMDTYPIKDQENWTPGIVGAYDIPEGFSLFATDDVPTCRLLNAPYSGNYEDSQVYVIDGFIVSDNLQVTMLQNVDTGFVYSDHQPVQMQVSMVQ